MSKKVFPFLVLLACLLVVAPASGQAVPAQPAQDVYAVINYLKIQPENVATYEEMARTTLRQYYVEALKQPGTNLLGWNMSRVLYRGLDDDAATHVGVIYYLGPPPGGDSEARNQAIMKKVTGTGYEDYRKKVRAIREFLGSELVRGMARGGSTVEGSYRVATFSKIAPFKTNEVRQNAVKIWQPVYDAAVKEGSILGFSSGTHVFPRGEGMEWDTVSSVTFKDLPSAVLGYAITPERLAKVHPEMGYLSVIENWRSTVTVKKVTITRIIASAMAPPPAK